jgi:hypothetical protein
MVALSLFFSVAGSALREDSTLQCAAAERGI